MVFDIVVAGVILYVLIRWFNEFGIRRVLKELGIGAIYFLVIASLVYGVFHIVNA